MKIIKFFDRLEDRVRFTLSKHPLVYTFIGGVAVVLFWRGVWNTADMIPWLTGPVSLLISTGVLLMIGLFVSFFIGDQQILSGLRKEKKLIEKTKEELDAEEISLREMHKEIEALVLKLEEISKRMSPR
ncbi:MAG: hypothetical protein HYT67_01930 [Candidatus Yanofskybacteria bacterium]|nr:hypothetical protein [Candidatus Yanofskybacteria bacterium]